MIDIIAIVGLGETRKYYKPIEGIISIGINDIWRYINTSHLLVTDHPCEVKHMPGYNDDRLNVFDVIFQSRPEVFYSTEDAYKDIPGFTKIRTVPLKECMRGNLITLDNPHAIPFSTNAPFTAACLAWSWFKPQQIVLYGVDFLSHSHNDPAILHKTLYDYQQLSIELKLRGCKLLTYSNESLLSDVIDSVTQPLKTINDFYELTKT
ncbi:MAG: hypothetical protein PHS33_07910 [Candidatus Omnitrophica bacterium]|nr:hypothetical protein [Candidatus Omnitrophota bacterium]